MKKFFGLMVFLMLLCMMSAAQAECEHQFVVENCTSERHCSKCDDWFRTNTEHSWGTWTPAASGGHIAWCTNYQCLAVSDAADHTGGTATCTDKAVCEVCGGTYGSVNSNAHDWGAWKSNADGTHTRVCLHDVAHTETGDCSGGDASCRPVCDFCGEKYENADGQHLNMSAWEMLSVTRHIRRCLDCGSYDEFGEHTGGEADCMNEAVCTFCNEGYGGYSSDHIWDDWYNPGRGAHRRMRARGCGAVEGGYCSGGTATCTEDGVCEVCDAAYIPAFGHDWADWQPNADGTHTRVCQNDAAHTETGSCELGQWGRLDGYVHAKFCIICFDQQVGAHTGGRATCSTPRICDVCEGEYGTPDFMGHPNPVTEMVAPTCLTDGYIRITCDEPFCCEPEQMFRMTAYGHLPGAEADCTHDQVCTRVECGEVLNEKLGHAYTAVVTKPLCGVPGYTTYTCSRCGDVHTADETKALPHWYALWHSNEDGTHSADCRREECSHTGHTACEPFEVTMKDGAGLTVCPVCGDYAGADFEVIAKAAIKAVDKDALPGYGEPIVRGMDAPFDGALYAFTAAYEFAGKVEPFRGVVSVSIPLDTEKYTGFRLMRADVSPAVEIAFTLEDGRLTFETDSAALLVLVAAE